MCHNVMESMKLMRLKFLVVNQTKPDANLMENGRIKQAQITLN